METRIKNLLTMLDGLTNVRQNFLVPVFGLFVSLPGRLNFLNMARYGTYSEKTSRQQFEHPVDWCALNQRLIDQVGSRRDVTTADARFLPKSGKHTPHGGHVWNGCVGKALSGMESHTLAVIDLACYLAFHRHTHQTPSDLPDDATRTQPPVHHISDHQTTLRHVSPSLVYDKRAANQPFFDRLVHETDRHLLSTLRCDAALQYLDPGPRRPGSGAPRKYDGKMHCAQPDLSRFDRCDEDQEVVVYPAVVSRRALKRQIRIASVLNTARDRSVILFSPDVTDVTLSGRHISEYYRARFQLEFLFRAATQSTGLTDCQARREQKIAFHLHASLTTVSWCRADFYVDASHRAHPFSMHDDQILQSTLARSIPCAFSA